ncbi:hypothetical protein APHAL10511_002470 [Amanita phalloides]|nr:hypothetical protein APHAL10511_002470 [Amanita phalloides]
MVSNCPNVLSHAVNAEALAGHSTGRRHKSCVSGRNVTLYCPICEINIDGGNWASHKGGRSHVNRAADKGLSPDIEAQDGINVPGEKYCDLCKIAITNPRWGRHLNSQQHLRRKEFTSYQAAIDAAEKEKNGITVEGNFDMGIVDLAQTSGTIRRSIILKMTTPDVRVKLTSWRLTSLRANTNNAFTVTQDGKNSIITSRCSVKLKITLNQTHIGRYEDRLELIFENVQSKRQFLISRSIRVVLGDKEDQQNLKASSSYISRSRTAPRKPETKIIKGEKPRLMGSIPYIVKLPGATIPPALLAALSEGSRVEITERIRATFLPAILDPRTHAKYFKTLLWIEEHRTEQDLEKYDLPDAILKKEGLRYFLEVPGLAEKRPSVLLGDRFLVQRHGVPEGHWFEGYVCVIRRDDVGLQFHRSFKGWGSSQLYHVRFKLNRITIQRQHYALDQAFKEDRILFPNVQHRSNLAPVTPRRLVLKYHDNNIATNPQQAQAVRSIVRLPPGSPPFVVFGPFGTGKTSTIVEAIIQILHRNPQARILACAPSNSAADLITRKLGPSLNKANLFRFNAPSRDKKALSDDILKFSHLKQLTGSDGPQTHFGVPDMDEFKEFRVVVSTCISGSVPASVGLPRGHFTHIFIDEAGQATESETLTPIKTIADNETNIVLAGDPKQLGPVIHSPIAQELGLQKSYLERLMEREAYDIANHSGVTVMKLLNNYRSHPAILKFPNDQFYNGELRAKASTTKTNRYLGCSILPRSTFPIIFHAIFGKDEREASSPSYFNVDEVTQVKQYVRNLRSDNRYPTTEDDIGIITPYYAQSRKIKKALLKIHAAGIKVGSVEEFQGQERPVIIISTVRSSQDLIEFDLRHTLGFVANPRRFNVAVTRSQALLIVVGDPQVLSLDPLWRTFLNYVYNNGGWRGPNPDWDTNAEVDVNGGYDRAVRERAEVDMNDFTRRLEALTMMGDDDGAWVDQAWRTDAE